MSNTSLLRGDFVDAVRMHFDAVADAVLGALVGDEAATSTTIVDCGAGPAPLGGAGAVPTSDRASSLATPAGKARWTRAALSDAVVT